VTGGGAARLALGTAALGDLSGVDGTAEAEATVRAAVAAGVRWFDTSPWYGLGAAEQRLGRALAADADDAVSVSTKVGYLVAADGGVDLAVGRGAQDFGAEATLRSVEASVRRLGGHRIDTVLIHDPDDHERAALDGAYPALHQLRADGVIRAIGVGMNRTAMLTRFVRDTDIDVVLVAGRYSLLDGEAAEELLPLCRQRGVRVMVGGVFNSGILADPRPGALDDYRPAEPARLARARSMARICAAYGVPLAAAALQFPGRHPAVTQVLMGPRSRTELAANLVHWQRAIPAGLWNELATLA
jgi:D-threo-aldose 1-dehydrogenase